MNEQPTLTTTTHDRNYYGEDSLIYPVLSRRVQGISVGINTSPSKLCNFGCIYCEVNRAAGGGILKFNLDVVDLQLRKVLANVQDGKLDNESIKAVALSGDGEPTSLRSNLSNTTIYCFQTTSRVLCNSLIR